MGFQAQVFGIAQRDTMSITFFQPPHGILIIAMERQRLVRVKHKWKCLHTRKVQEKQKSGSKKKGLHAGQGHGGEPLYG